MFNPRRSFMAAESGRARAQKRLPAEVRQQLLDAIYSGHPFRTVLGDLGLTSNQVWGLTRTDQEWSEKLEAALTATRRDDMDHGTNAACVQGCVCNECREHQRVRMAQNRKSLNATLSTTTSPMNAHFDSLDLAQALQVRVRRE